MQGKYLIEAGCTVVDTPKIAEDLDALMSIRHPTPSSPALPVWLAWLTYPKLPRTSTYSASPDRFPFGILCCPLMFGLPNISGTMSVPVSRSWDGLNVVAGGNGSVNGTTQVSVTLSGSAIFGNSTTVQPSSIRCLACIKL